MATQLLEYQLDESGFNAECYFPGMTFDDFDTPGDVSLWKICRMFEAGRVVPFIHGNYLDFNKLRSSRFHFSLIGGDYYFDSCRSIWEVARRFHYFPYKITVELINVGQSSITIREVLVNLLDNKEIATFYGKFVYVDKMTKRSQVLPHWHRLKYQKAESDDKMQFDSSLKSAPDNAYRVKRSIAASDTFNDHTNQASYVRFALDAAECARKAQCLSQFTSDICQYPVLKMCTSYRGETLLNDEITTSVWQDNNTPAVLNFTIHKDNTLCFTASVTFKPAPCSKL
ncbi:uncharacterized protein LOC131958231 [Physella acuta]|uniref:uncharacterized protein LOC131958231 n=1 Tax=Physella acuta TaxID=109671 RepID=UPI0027DBFCCE|nr:uncharacterized protein LOC131958231 [Physella acuta]XP_059179112.1 uncharacterized protein LOC131958231 [Physella acuta]